MTGKEILAEINKIFIEKWSFRAGRKVPEPEELQLSNEGVTLQGTVLYADMVDSTNLVNGYKAHFAAEIYKAYLIGACRVISNNGGQITAFDGDRVMAVFFGSSQNSSAAKAALQINRLVYDINAALKVTYPSTSYVLRHGIGIDVSDLLVARTGVRNANDLVWVGRAANYAAKLSAFTDINYPAYITEDVYTRLTDDSKYGGNPRTLMWEKRIWTDKGLVVYRSGWYWPI